MEKILKNYPNAVITKQKILIDLLNNDNICIQFDLLDINLSYVLDNEELTFFLKKLISYIDKNYLEELNDTLEDKIFNILEALEKKFSKTNNILTTGI